MVEWKNNNFYINGEETKIYSGAVHYFRSLPEKWYDILYRLKCAGLNTVETYCAWNLHEENEGEFNFEGRLDIERFIKTAADLGLYVIIRPGPYICAEWENGGFPGWILKDENIRLRNDEPMYFDKVKRYFKKLFEHIIPYLETKGGNVILLAAENEYGSFGNSTEYMNLCVELLKELGVDVPIFTADGHTRMFLDGGHADNTLCCLDFGYDNGITEEHLKALKELQPDSPIFHVEHWIGMFSRWGEPLMTYDGEVVADEIATHLKMGNSFNLYVFHGGTNFGFTNGANDVNTDPEDRMQSIYAPDVTSYDYDAPLTEWGDCTPKYFAIKREMEKHLGKTFPTPEPIKCQSIGKIELTESTGLFNNLENIGGYHKSSTLRSMEYFGQNFGYILYRTKIRTNGADMLGFSQVSDRVHIYFDGEYKGTISRNDKKKYIEIDGWLKEGGTLDLLVENMGRLNFGPYFNRGDRKGLFDFVYISQKAGPRQALCNWEVFTLPMNNTEKLCFDKKAEKNQPAFYKGYFKAEEKLDCFVHPTGFTKGFIVVNGFNLGKYWKVGPQLSLYLPGSILKEQNEIIVYDEEPVENPVIEIKDTHILNSMETKSGPVTIV